MQIIDNFFGEEWDFSTTGVNFALANISVKDNIVKRLSRFSSCRSYIGDYLWDLRVGRLLSPPNLSNVGDELTPDACISELSSCILIFLPTKTSIFNLKKNISILHKIEKNNGFDLTEIIKTDRPNQLVLCGDRRWFHCTFMSSLWTYFLKVCTNRINTREWYSNLLGNELSYYNRTYPILEKVLLDLNNIVAVCTTVNGFPERSTYSYIENHVYSGFVSCIQHRNLEITRGNTIAAYIYNTYRDVK